MKEKPEVTGFFKEIINVGKSGNNFLIVEKSNGESTKNFISVHRVLFNHQKSIPSGDRKKNDSRKNPAAKQCEIQINQSLKVLHGSTSATALNHF